MTTTSPEATITSDNFEEFTLRLNALPSTISIYRCLQDLTDLAVADDAFNNLTEVNFSCLTTLNNLETIIRTCPNLTTLTFNEALLDTYSLFYNDPPHPHSTLVHETLNHLKVIRPLELSRNEYWLLHYFTHKVDLPNIQSLSFYCYTTIGGANVEMEGGPEAVISLGLNLETNEVTNKYMKINASSTITDFLSKYQKTLKNLWIGRPGFELPQQQQYHHHPEDLEEPLLLFPDLQLQFLSVSLGSSGVRHLLQTQRNLETLNLVSNLSLKTYGADTIATLISEFLNCLRNNTRTLKEVQIIPTLILGDISREEILGRHEILDRIQVNCDLFTQCKNLNYLCLSLRAYRSEVDMWRDSPPLLQGTKLRNIHRIPAGALVELYLPVEEFSRDELELLAGRFKEFRNLKKLYFGTSHLNIFNIFLIRTPWITDLISLPAVERVIFHNGVMQDIVTTKELVNKHNSDSCAGSVVTLEYTPPRYTFHFLRK